MTPKEILNSVPREDAPSSTTKPKNNLWTWVVGMLTVVCVVLWGVTMQNNRQTLREKDATIQVWKDNSNAWQKSDSLKGVRLDECNARNLSIQSTGQQQLLEYLHIIKGKRQTISISPKSTGHE